VSDVGDSETGEWNVTAAAAAAAGQCQCAPGWHGARCQSRTTDTCEVSPSADLLLSLSVSRANPGMAVSLQRTSGDNSGSFLS